MWARTHMCNFYRLPRSRSRLFMTPVFNEWGSMFVTRKLTFYDTFVMFTWILNNVVCCTMPLYVNWIINGKLHSTTMHNSSLGMMHVIKCRKLQSIFSFNKYFYSFRYIKFRISYPIKYYLLNAYPSDDVNCPKVLLTA